MQRTTVILSKKSIEIIKKKKSELHDDSIRGPSFSDALNDILENLEK